MGRGRKHRVLRPSQQRRPAFRNQLQLFSFRRLLQFLDVEFHHFKHGRHDALGAPGEKWINIQTSLMQGRRGLPGGFSLAKLLAEKRPAK